MEYAEEARRVGAPLGFISGSTWSVAVLCECLADEFAGLDHAIRLGLAGGMCTVVAEVDALEEQGKFPSLDIGQNNFDLYGFHHVLRWMGGSPALAPHPPENSARPELTGRLSLGFAKPMRGQWPPAAAAEAAGSGFALEGSPLGAVCRAASTARAAKGWAGDKDC